MPSKITPLQHHILLRFALKDGAQIIAPNGKRPIGDVIVEALGPDVPPGFVQIGDKVLLRGDAKVFGTDQEGGDETTGIVPFQMIMAVVTTDEDEQTLPLPFEQEMAAAMDGDPELDKLVDADDRKKSGVKVLGMGQAWRSRSWGKGIRT